MLADCQRMCPYYQAEAGHLRRFLERSIGFRGKGAFGDDGQSSCLGFRSWYLTILILATEYLPSNSIAVAQGQPVCLRARHDYPLPLDNNPALTIHLSIPMSRQGLTIAQAARSLGVSTRTIRRFIKSGKIHAALVPGPFGQEYRILKLPPDLHKPKPVDNTLCQTPSQTPSQLMDIIRELQEKNLALAAQLGAATERIRNLESKVRLLVAARQPWWKRLFTKKG